MQQCTLDRWIAGQRLTGCASFLLPVVICVQVRESDALVSLPNNLTGYVEVDEVSDELNGLIEEALEDEDADAPALSDYLWAGQSVYCVVISTATVKGKKHISISLKPSRFNHALSLENAHVGMPVYGAVSAVEDHGYSISLGTNELSAFIPQAAGKGLGRAGAAPLVGQLISAVASKVKKEQKLVVLSGEGPGEATKEVEDIALDQLQPGMLVDCRVLKVLENGLVVTFLGSFVGTIDRFHLTLGAGKAGGKAGKAGKGDGDKKEEKKKKKKDEESEEDEDMEVDDDSEDGDKEDQDAEGVALDKLFREKQKLQARIIYTDIGAKAAGLSTRRHILERTVPDFIKLGIKVGRIFGESHISRILPGVGMMIRLPAAEAGSLEGWVHISEAADERVEKLEKTFKVGRKVACRVVSYSWMDGMVNLTLKASVLSDEVVDYGDVEIGAVVKGKVIKLDTFGCLVALSSSAQGVRGLIPPIHLSDATLHAPEKRFVAGKQISVRVLSKDEDKKRCILTAKKSMVNSPHPIIETYDVQPGTCTHGYVAKVLPNGILVAFYGKMRAFAMISQLGIDTEKDSVEEAFRVGQSVQCKVLSTDPEHKRMKISLNMDDSVLERKQASATPSKDSLSSVFKIGETVGVTVTGKSDKSVLVKGSDGSEGHIPFAHLSDHTDLCTNIMEAVKEGTRLEALVLQHERSKSIYLLTLKPSLIAAAKADELPMRVKDVSPQQFVQGYVSATADYGVFVNFLGGLSALAPKANLTDAFVSSVADEYTEGQSVRCCVVSADVKEKKVTVTLKPSLCMCPDDSFLSSLLEQIAFAASLKAPATKKASKGKAASSKKADSPAVGSLLEGTVEQVKEYGALFALPGGATGFAPTGQFPSGLKKGGKHEAVCLDVDPLRDIITVSLDKDMVASAKVSSSKRASLRAKIHPSDTVDCTVLSVLPGRVVLALAEHGNLLAVSASQDYNLRGEKAESRFQVGKTVTAVVMRTDGERISVGCRPDLGQQSSKPSNKDKKEKSESDKKADLAAIGGGIVSIDDAKVGMKLKCVVSGSTGSHVSVKLGQGVKGQIHITDLMDKYEGTADPLKGFKQSSVVEAVVVGVHKVDEGKAGNKGAKKDIVELSLKPSILALKKGQKPPARVTLSSLNVGDVLTGFVDDVKKDSVWVNVAPGLRGKVHALDASTDLQVIQSLSTKFKPRTPVLCRVVYKNEEEGKLDLSTRMPEENGQTPKKRKGAAAGKASDFAVGQVVVGKVSKITPGISLLLQLGSRRVGRVNICDVCDLPEEDPFKAFKLNQFVHAAVVNVDGDKVELSLRPSRTGAAAAVTASKVGKKRGAADASTSDEIAGTLTMPEVAEVKDLSPGQLISGYVKTTSSSGCFVMLSRSVTARVGISQLSDRYIQDVKGGFPPGKLVHGRILSVDTAKGLVDMSLKRSVVLAKKRVLYTDLEVGQIVKGHVKSIQAFGIFVRIKDSELDGLCHISEVTSEYVKDLGKLYSSGDKVKAKIIKLDKTKKTISLGMKESHFEGVEDEDDDDDSDAGGPGGKVQDSGSEGMSDDDDDGDGDGDDDMDEDDGEDDDQDDDDDDGDDDDDDDDDDDVEMSGIGSKKVKKGGNAMEMDSDESESESGDDDDDGIGKTTTAGFEWDGFGSKANQEEDSDDSDNDEDDEEEMDGESAASKSKEKRRKKREKERAEALTREKEAALLDPERAPETAEEFERLVVSSPNRCRLSTFHYSRPFISSAILATLCSFPLFF